MRYSTRSFLHVDRCASAWLIKRFIDTDAEFVFVDDHDPVPGTIPFDMHGVARGHHANRCTFETIVHLHQISDPALLQIARIIHGADITADADETLESPGIDLVFQGLRLVSNSDEEAIERGYLIMDALYAAMNEAQKSLALPGKEDTQMNAKPFQVALLWHGDREARDTTTLERHRFTGVAEALREVGIEPEPAVYNDEFADEVREQLLQMDGVLVWVNPIEQGRDRTVLDSTLRQVSEAGVFVSAHPDIILKMGTKEVLYETRKMTWGSDTYLYTSIEELLQQLPRRLAEGKSRVLKQYRGNGGNGVWKVERHPFDTALVRVRHALRGSIEQDIPLTEFLAQCETYFLGSGRIIDQPYQERLPDGMVRCYLVGSEVVGFGHQAINALFPAPSGGSHGDAPQPGPRLYYPPTKPEFQAIKTKMETEWVDALCDTLSIEASSLPLLWDADLLYGPRTESEEDTYVLCEINVSAVSPFPEEALKPLAQATKEKLMSRRS